MRIINKHYFEVNWTLFEIGKTVNVNSSCWQIFNYRMKPVSPFALNTLQNAIKKDQPAISNIAK